MYPRANGKTYSRSQTGRTPSKTVAVVALLSVQPREPISRACMQASAWSPAAAAVQQLVSEKPEIYERIERTVAQSKIARGNRKYRLDSLGERTMPPRMLACAFGI